MKAFQAACLFFLGSVSATSLRVLQGDNVTIATDDINVTVTTALPTEPASEGVNSTEAASEGTNATDGNFGSGLGELASGIANSTAEAVSGFTDVLQNNTGFNDWLENVANGGDNTTEVDVTGTAPSESGSDMEGEGSEGAAEESTGVAEEGTEPATGSAAAAPFASISAFFLYAVSVVVSL
ncbi:hypothetical protein HJC23_013334 [Cyclotella cryptica]|uniref:Uncharacterized protein n=1 Tax=Cyclotella cryptica TaxID=29204 RepID=A0ABD3Q135_9STRA|eukprot:CCRYP_009754-RA/>CCRYP_009754-RA protein AED:0.31 eAED:0.31 QI:0/-1/0/1/-1/1/1/0/181